MWSTRTKLSRQFAVMRHPVFGQYFSFSDPTPLRFGDEFDHQISAHFVSENLGLPELSLTPLRFGDEFDHQISAHFVSKIWVSFNALRPPIIKINAEALVVLSRHKRLFYFVGQSLTSLEFYNFFCGNLNCFTRLRIPAFSCLPFYDGETYQIRRGPVYHSS